MADAFKFRIDHHGSLVRPPEVLAATGSSDQKSVEDAAIASIVREQRNRNLAALSDGQFRRSHPIGFVAESIEGIDAAPRGFAAVGVLRATKSLAGDDLGVITEVTQSAIKVSLPSAAAMAEYFYDSEASSEAFGSPKALGEAFAEILQAEVQQLLAAGVRLIQLDHHGYDAYLSTGSEESASLTLDEAIAIDSAVVTDLDVPPNAKIGMCPTIAIRGGLDVDAATKLFASIPVDRWAIPFFDGSDDELALLRAIPADADACLGVLDASNSEILDHDVVLDRLDAAAEIRNEEDIALSPNRGFADVATDPLVSVDQQWATIVHVETLARMFWGNEL